jgi:hypothetical protein
VTTLEGLVALARRRANRRLMAGALTTALLPAVGVALLWKGTALITSSPAGTLSVALPVLVGLVAGIVLGVTRRLDAAGAALLLDRRAGTQERCVTGLRSGGRVARDAEARLDRDRVCAALAFRPPATALALLLAAAALAALHLLPGLGVAPMAPGSGGVEAILAGVGGASPEDPSAPGGAADALKPAEDPEVLRWIDRAQAPLPGGAVAKELADARAALERGDRDDARKHLENALDTALVTPDGDAGAASRRIRMALDAAGGASRASGSPDLNDRVDWGRDGDLVRRYLLALF